MPPLRSDQLLVVCRANHTRSPLVASLLRQNVPGLVVGSAGTHALPARSGADPQLVEVVRRRGIDPVARDLREHRPRAAKRRLLGAADLILTATRDIRGQMGIVAPGADAVSFTIHEAVELVTGFGATPIGGRPLREIAVEWGVIRRDRWSQIEARDLHDPTGGPVEEYQELVDTALAAVATMSVGQVAR